jgi:hypothetical protein
MTTATPPPPPSSDLWLPTSGDPELEYSEEQPFALPKRGSIWTRTGFTPTYDPWDVAQTTFQIPERTGKRVPFKPFVTQQLFMDRLGLRNVVVKPRQVGLSTAVRCVTLPITFTTPNLNGLVMTHLKTTTEAMRQEILRIIRNLEADFGWKIAIGTNNKEELEFPELDSWIYFSTSGSPGAGRSRTIHWAHLSEVAFWEGNEYGAILESVPDSGLVVAESTPNGAEGTFYNLFTEESSYVKHFYPWFIEPWRRIPGAPQLTYTEEEQLLVFKYQLDNEQIAWRRWKAADMKANGNTTPFTQEYPEDEVTCFTAGVRTAFPPHQLIMLSERAKAVRPSIEPVPSIENEDWDPGGEILIWDYPQPGRDYMVTCDVGAGLKDGDKSWAIVRDTMTGRHVATLRGRWTPTRFARHSVALAYRYNTAYLSHERVGLGVEAANEAAMRMNYPNYHWDTTQEGVPRPGFYVAQNQRTPLIAAVVQEVVTGDFLSFDEELVRQLTAVRIERGRLAGGWGDIMVTPQSVHDDGLMAYAQSVALMRSAAVIVSANRPKPKQVT